MTNPPNGQLVATADGNPLVVSRTLRAPIEDVWASITEPDRTARWFGTLTGDGAPAHDQGADGLRGSRTVAR
jgi:uncharacterized protein YndB with AHSA1/START domain